MRLPYLLAAGAALGAADDGAPRAQTQGKERNPPAWPAAVRVVAPAQCAEISAADAGAALLLLPGVYDCSISLPSRSTAAGLGTDRDDVLLKRCVGDAASSAENLRVDGDWRGPRSVRRVAVAGDLKLLQAEVAQPRHELVPQLLGGRRRRPRPPSSRLGP